MRHYCFVFNANPQYGFSMTGCLSLAAEYDKSSYGVWNRKKCRCLWVSNKIAKRKRTLLTLFKVLRKAWDIGTYSKNNGIQTF